VSNQDHVRPWPLLEQEGEAVTLLAGWLDAAWCLLLAGAVVVGLWGFNQILDEFDNIRKGGGK
jgi:hypothetical protein